MVMVWQQEWYAAFKKLAPAEVTPEKKSVDKN